MDYVLKGSLYKEVLYNLDKTLTVEGLGADAKAVGDALKGMAPVDDLITDDMNKPLSARQGKVLDEKMTEELNGLRKEIEETDVGAVKATADEALAKANSANTIATEAQKQVENALEVVVWTVNGVAPDRNHNVNVSTDKSLTLENVPADAKAVGDMIKSGGGAVDASLTIMGQAADAYVTGYRLTEAESKVQTNLESIGQHTLLIQNLTNRITILEQNGVSNLPNAEEVSF